MPFPKRPSWIRGTLDAVENGLSSILNGLFVILSIMFRFGPSVLVLAILLGAAAGLAWLYWFKLDFAHLLVANAKDSPHENMNFVVTVICLPLQTLLLLIAGLYGWSTLRQNLRFKRHDVEQQCMDEYLKIEEEIRTANKQKNPEKIRAAVERYWVQLNVEFYWWRRGLISRELFLMWTQWQANELRENRSFYPGSPIRNRVEGYETFRPLFSEYRSFVPMMDYLRARSQHSEQHLQWFHIERFRYPLTRGPI